MVVVACQPGRPRHQLVGGGDVGRRPHTECLCGVHLTDRPSGGSAGGIHRGPQLRTVIVQLQLARGIWELVFDLRFIHT